MLIWMYMKQNKFGAALAQVKALDKRNKEDGERVMELADLAFNNFKYGVAIEGYTYVRDKGPRSYYYIESITGLLRHTRQSNRNRIRSKHRLLNLLLSMKPR